MQKNHGLTKSELCWVLVKLAGAVLVYQGIAGFYAAIVTWVSMGDLLEGLSDKAKSRAFLPIKVIFWSILLPFAFGASFLVSGTTFHRLLMRVPLGCLSNPKPKSQSGGLAKNKGEPIGGDTLAERRLTAEEYDQFLKWFAANPEIAKRDDVDQLALFRDAQKAGEV